MYDVKINFVSPNSLRIPSEYYQENDREFSTLGQMIGQTDVLYLTRVQKERMETADSLKEPYVLTTEDMRRARSNMVLMHPLPRVDELPKEFDNDPRAAYFRQMKYGLYIRMALLHEMLKNN